MHQETSSSYHESHALVIGINKYSTASPLGYAVSDAEEVADLLNTKFDFNQKNIKLLVDDKATRKVIHKSFLEFSGDSTHIDDRLIVFFAGHGHTETTPSGDSVGYLVPHDGNLSDLSTLIRWDTLTRDADLINAKHLLFIMDSCYGGLAITRSPKPGSTRFLKDMLKRNARQVLTAGKADEVVADLGGPRPNHSVFTGHFLDALEGAATSEGVITGNGVMAYVYRQVGSDANSSQTPHYGYLKGDGDFIFNPPKFDQIEKDNQKEEDRLIAIHGANNIDDPPNGQSLSEKVKSFIATKDQIKLHDLIVSEARKVISEITEENFKVQGKWSEEEFVQRINDYNKSIEQLSVIEMLLGHWGTASHSSIIELPIKRLAEQVTLQSGLKAWLALRWYPILLLIYSCGLGAVASQNYSNLLHVLHATIPDERNRYSTITIIEALYIEFAEIGDLFKTLPGHERHYVPVSEFLFKELQPLADDILFIGRDYDKAFDRLEILIALECAFIENGWGPIGRFGWKHSGRRGSANSPLTALINEAQTAGINWKPIQAGFFSGSIQDFNATIDKYLPMINRLHWH